MTKPLSDEDAVDLKRRPPATQPAPKAAWAECLEGEAVTEPAP